MAFTAEDRLRIEELITLVYRGLDNHSGAEYASYFTEDGVLANDAFGTITGTPEIAKFVDKHCADGNEDGALHVPTNAVFSDVEDDEATIYMEVMKYRVSVTPPEPWVSAFVTARARRVASDWRVARFELGIRSAVYADYEKYGS